MTEHIATAFFESRADAMQAIEELERAGIPRAKIRLMPESDAGSASTTVTQSAYDANRDEKGFWASLGDMFFPTEDRYAYAEAMHRGDIMVSVTLDPQHAERAEDILEKYGTVDMADREASWRQQGWTGYTGNARGTPAPAAKGAGENVIPIAEEQLKIGKRQLGGGRIKVRSYVVETPVHE